MKILILTNHQLGLYKFRKELLERLVKEGHDVYVSVPEDEFTKELTDIGTKLIHNTHLDRRGTNPIRDIKLINYYRALIRDIKPDAVLTYTIKPNIYGGYVCKKMGVPYIANVTGLGTSIQKSGLMQKLILAMYKSGLDGAKRVFFQNEENKSFMVGRRIVKPEKTDVLPGSGVNTSEHCYEPYPDDEKIVFTTVGRIMKDKGIDELLSAAKSIRERHPDTEFWLIGGFDEDYKNVINEYEKQGIIKYLGFQKDVHSFMGKSHAIIHASYHEGMSNILQEAASTGRPVIATDVHGCIETFDDKVTGIAFKARDAESLVSAIERFLNLSRDERIAMGKAGREKMEKEFSREIVIDKYMAELEDLKRI